MKRREFFNKAAVSSLGLGAAALILPKTAVASLTNGNEEEPIVLHEISRNHGHVLALELTDLLVLFRRLNEEKTISIDITGRSRHAHSIELSFENTLNILLGETVQIVSSKDSGHSHAVSISLKID